MKIGGNPPPWTTHLETALLWPVQAVNRPNFGCLFDTSQSNIEEIDAIAAAKAAGYDCWRTVKAFDHALPDIAAASRVWRPLFTTETEVTTEAIALIRRGLQENAHAY